LKAHFNLTHTIADIRAFIDAATPVGTQVRAYSLMTTYPKKVLNDMTQSVEAAGLKGAQIIQTPL
jgi:UBX domain-containing protein 1